MKSILLPLLTIILLFTSCVPQQSVSGRKIASQIDSGATDDTTTTTDDSVLVDYHWYSSGAITNGIINLDNATNDSIFIRGTGIDAWLNIRPNPALSTTYFDHNFCLVGTFDEAGAKKQARYRAIPMSYRDPVTGKVEKLLRVDIASAAESNSLCGGTLTLTLKNGSINGTETHIVDSTDTAFDLSTVCPTCQVSITASHLGLVFFDKANTLSSTPLPTEQDSYYQGLSALGLTIKPSSAPTSGGNNTCSDNACQALNKDCCLSGQCVINGAIRPEASGLADYSQAMSDFAINPSTYVNWPQIFYVCQGSINPIPTPTPTPTPDPGGVADAELAELIKKYNCLEGAKLSPVDYSSCEPNSDLTSFETIRTSVWQTCGCEADYTLTDTSDPDHPINACPDFGLKVTERDASDNPTKIECLVPDPDPIPTPFQELNLQVSSRSVPHRFFQTDGTAIDDLSKSSTTVLQEAATTDENGHFSMNRILGDILVDLSKAQPAKMINVQFNQSYVIRTKAGSYYTPCPECSKDQWYEGFTAFAQPFPVRGELFGNGLQASPTTTNRATSSISSISKGNYEDTIWGRACWVPPTMLPYAHSKNSNVQTQRRNRLETQAAMYMNGYRKDWFGFNQGALIGSFDGTKWFAIGSGRQVTATSTKLYLAINAPFADFASLSSMSVEIVEYLGPNSVAIHDFDPELSLNDPRQNLAASCQAYHICNVDADCITKLGWEYMCAPISYHKTNIPKFDINGNEVADEAVESDGFMKMLQTGVAPSSFNKRCVYRGAGAPCLKDIQTLATTNDNRLRHLACAPNFYCAPIEGNFNSDINRDKSLLGSIKYGQEANVLGRPANYVGGDTGLLNSIQTNIEANMKLYDDTYVKAKIGLCRPGKAIMSNPYAAHSTADVQKRTDYISQIASCEPTKQKYERVMSCPYLIEESDITGDAEDLPESQQPGNYQFISGTVFDLSVDAPRLKQQNSCGQEALDVNGNSPFNLIEALRIPLLTSLDRPKLPINGCFRRAGSVCHTDLDCSPNILQEKAGLSYDESYFGGTTAEKEFWRESLVCAQAASIPSVTDIATASYSLTKNRCCRQIGKDFTMYTMSDTQEFLGDDINPNNLRNNGTGLKTNLLTVDDPSAIGRYSRYISSNPVFGTKARNVGGVPNIHAETPAVFDRVGVGENEDPTHASKTPHAFQWKTIHDTGRRTCCGNSFIRKFSDGTHNWTKRDRLRLNSDNFKCLNYENMLYDTSKSFHYDANKDGTILATETTTLKDLMYSSTSQNFTKEESMMCLSPGDGGCIQIPFETPTDSFGITAPDLVSSKTAIMTTVPIIGDDGQGYQRTTRDAPYLPSGYNMTYPASASIPGQDYSIPSNYMPGLTQQFLYMHLPIYIDINTIDSNSDGYIDTKNFQNIGDNTTTTLAATTAPEVYIHYICEGAETTEKSAISTTTDAYIIKMTYQPDVTTAGSEFKCDNLINGGVEFADNDAATELQNEHWCLTTGGILFANAQANAPRNTICKDSDGADVPWSYAGIKIKFTPINTAAHIYNNSTLGPTLHPEIQGLKGTEGTDELHNATYYLTKLGRMELLGIPQIYYEPLYCNSTHSELVNGLYSTAVSPQLHTATNLMTFSEITGLFKYGGDPNIADANVANSLGRIYADSSEDTNFYRSSDINGVVVDASNPDNFVMLQNMINETHSPIFSSYEFSCCTKLGSLTSDYNNCCSGYGKQESGNLSYTCLLPTGTDLNVYFNRFVSSEGYVDDLPELLQEFGLTDNDFVPETGEPKLQTNVYDKLDALGKAYCDSGNVRTGAAFGKYHAEPFVGYTRDRNDNEEDKRYFSIIDSQDDFDADASNGNTYFNFGFRWNHHLYCDL